MLRRYAAVAAMALGLVSPALAEDEALVTFHVLAPKLAMQLAEAAVEDCNAKGFQVAVAVVDRFGVPQALLRDRFAGPHTPDTAIRKAWTAVSFRSDTVELVDATQSGTPQSGARDITNVLMLGGGTPIDVGGSMVGGVGVSGAPTGEEDDACAKAGIAAIEDQLPL